MENIAKTFILSALLLTPTTLFAWSWKDLWQTPDQQGAQLFQAGKTKEAAQVFKAKNWQAVALYKSGDYTQAFKQFSEGKASDDQYNAGNAAAFQGHYKEAIEAYDKAIALNANNADAITNRDIIKKLLDKKNKEQKKPESNSADNKKNQQNEQDQQNQQNQQSQKDQQKDKKDNNASSTNDMAQNDKKNEQNNKDQQPKDQQPQAGNESQQQSANNNSGQMPGKQKPDSKQQNEQMTADNARQDKDENKKQLMRRLADDPGGLLRQKFLRDYLRRHTADQASDQGDN